MLLEKFNLSFVLVWYIKCPSATLMAIPYENKQSSPIITFLDSDKTIVEMPLKKLFFPIKQTLFPLIEILSA